MNVVEAGPNPRISPPSPGLDGRTPWMVPRSTFAFDIRVPSPRLAVGLRGQLVGGRVQNERGFICARRGRTGDGDARGLLCVSDALRGSLRAREPVWR